MKGNNCSRQVWNSTKRTNPTIFITFVSFFFVFSFLSLIRKPNINSWKAAELFRLDIMKKRYYITWSLLSYYCRSVGTDGLTSNRINFAGGCCRRSTHSTLAMIKDSDRYKKLNILFVKRTDWRDNFKNTIFLKHWSWMTIKNTLIFSI